MSNSSPLSSSIKILFLTALTTALLATATVGLLGRPVPAAEAADGEASAPLPAPALTASVAPTAPPQQPPTTAPELAPAAPPATPAATPPVTATRSLTHQVRAGDTLAAIARAYGVSVADLLAVNQIPNPDLLYVGWTLDIPEHGRPIPPTAPVTETEAITDASPPSHPAVIPEPTLPAEINEERWIDVDLSEQRLTAYEGGAPVHAFLVSTGLPATPTPVGQFRIWIKFRYDDMAGPGYYIEDVPFVMYFYDGYGLHGVTWHGNFGHPMSHGCVNLPTDEAEWLFGFADVGTLVNVRE